MLRVVPWVLGAVVFAGCYGSQTSLSGDGGEDTPPADEASPPPDVVDATDTTDAADASCPVDPAARANPGFEVTRLTLVRPAVLGSVAPTLDARILDDDIFVVINTTWTPASSAFHIEVGPAFERTYPSRSAMFCRDEICGRPPNHVSILDAAATCDDFATTSSADLIFSLYPPAHPGSATPLHIYNASFRGRFDARRERILEGTVTGGILEGETPLVFPTWGVSLDDLLRGAGAPLDFHIDRDGIPDGWTVEIRFEAAAIDVVDG